MKSDKQLQDDVLNQLDWEPSIDASQVGVTAQDGVVTLTGRVPRYIEKMEAERVTKLVSGVRGVANDMEIHLPGGSERNDTDIAKAALTALEWNVLVPHDKIQVTVRDGWIYLEGQVNWQYQRNAAGESLHSLMGVKGVTNQITLLPQVQPKDVRTKIEAAFRRSAEIDAGHVKVEVHDGTVILHGKVPSWTERKEAEQASWSAPGVRSVDNRLTVGA